MIFTGHCHSPAEAANEIPQESPPDGLDVMDYCGHIQELLHAVISPSI